MVKGKGKYKIRSDATTIVQYRRSDQWDLPLDVVVKEISVEQSLDHPADINYPVVPVILFCIGTVDPVEDVQSAVGTHEKDVISSQVFDLSVALENNQLRQNRNGFQVNRESPEQFHDTELADARSNQVGKERQDKTRCCSKLPVQEGILTFIISTLNGFLVFYGVNDRSCGADINDFHDRIVKRVIRCEKVQISGHKHNKEKLMRADRDSCPYDGGISTRQWSE